MNSVACINCGSACSSIYKQFSKDIIKLTTCVSFPNVISVAEKYYSEPSLEWPPFYKIGHRVMDPRMKLETLVIAEEKCGELVDEYAETEFSIVLIDMLLLKKAALRHVLFNSNFQGAWKLIVLFILCDAYEKTSQKYFSKPSTKHGDYIIDLELNFYLMCIRSFLEYLIFATLVVVVLYQSHTKDVTRFTFKYFSRGIVLASYGKLFMLPLLIWSKNDDYCEILIIMFIFLSQLQVIRVTTEMPCIIIAIILIVMSETGNFLLRSII